MIKDKRVAGIVCEYDPFHRGHAYHIEETRRKTGADVVVCAMSGPFCQRGTPAAFDAFTRARMACAGGADLVLMLPAAVSTGSAETFAHGAVSLLAATGIVDLISFGAETADLSLLSRAADLLTEEPAAVSEGIRRYAKKGLSYPEARARALTDCGEGYAASVIASPNNILAVEYIRSLKALGSAISPFAVKRSGAGYHDDELTGGNASAGAIRKLLREKGDRSLLASLIPTASLKELENTYPALLREDFVPLHQDHLSQALFFRLAHLSLTDTPLTDFRDVSADLAARIKEKASSCKTFDELAAAVWHKGLTWARVDRALSHILLGIREDEDPAPSYLRVLALKKSSSFLLGAISEQASLPLITRISEAGALTGKAATDFKKDLFAEEHCRRAMVTANGTELPDIRHAPFMQFV